ncbi:hypothetical protein B0T19DRAFT_456969 [Cercophora scortea]|uniref:Uncharacterized protein n=1 Tax=Cercophora scortea TaxID=314031 RepID=A0AAE0IWG0_9PEZI|nr:hypothetical protein B0T19DRAFT_456969 [Cercophora scortea]
MAHALGGVENGSDSEHGDGYPRARKRQRGVGSQGDHDFVLSKNFYDDSDEDVFEHVPEEDNVYEDQPDEGGYEEDDNIQNPHDVQVDSSKGRDRTAGNPKNSSTGIINNQPAAVQYKPEVPHMLHPEEPKYLRVIQLFQETYYPRGFPSHIDANEMAKHLGRMGPDKEVSRSHYAYRAFYQAMKAMKGWMQPDRFADWRQARAAAGEAMPAVGSPSQIMAVCVIGWPLPIPKPDVAPIVRKFAADELQQFWTDSMLDFVLEEPQHRQVPAYWKDAKFDSTPWCRQHMAQFPVPSRKLVGRAGIEKVDLNKYFCRSPPLPGRHVLATPAASFSPRLAAAGPSSAGPTWNSSIAAPVHAQAQTAATAPRPFVNLRTQMPPASSHVAPFNTGTNTSGGPPRLDDALNSVLDGHLKKVMATLHTELQSRDSARQKERREAEERARKFQAQISQQAAKIFRLEQQIKVLKQKVTGAHDDSEVSDHASSSSGFDPIKMQSARPLNPVSVPVARHNRTVTGSQPLTSRTTATLAAQSSQVPAQPPQPPRRSPLTPQERATVHLHLSWVPRQDRERILQLTNALPLSGWQRTDEDIAATLDSQYRYKNWVALVGDLRDVLTNLEYIHQSLETVITPKSHDDASKYITIRDLDRRRLSFENNNRPGARYLSFLRVFVVAQLKTAWRHEYMYQKDKDLAIVTKLKPLPQLGKEGFWATRERYLDRALLLALAKELLGHEHDTSFPENIPGPPLPETDRDTEPQGVRRGIPRRMKKKKSDGIVLINQGARLHMATSDKVMND